MCYRVEGVFDVEKDHCLALCPFHKLVNKLGEADIGSSSKLKRLEGGRHLSSILEEKVLLVDLYQGVRDRDYSKVLWVPH